MSVMPHNTWYTVAAQQTPHGVPFPWGVAALSHLHFQGFQQPPGTQFCSLSEGCILVCVFREVRRESRVLQGRQGHQECLVLMAST